MNIVPVELPHIVYMHRKVTLEPMCKCFFHVFKSKKNSEVKLALGCSELSQHLDADFSSHMVSSSLGCCASKPASWNLSGRAVMLLQRLGSLLLLWEMKFLTCDHCSHWRGESILGDLSFHLFLPLKEFFESFSSPFLWCRDLGAHLGSRGH